MSYSYKLGVIGCGNMATAILNGALSSLLKPSDVFAYDSDGVKAALINKNYGVKIAESNADVVKNCEYVLFAVKPQSVGTLDIADIKINCLISIMAGVKISTLRERFNVDSVVRIMPNTPCSVGYGMCALTYCNASEEQKNFVTSLFQSTGETIELSEDKFDAVTAVSGSGPAYVYYFIEAMAKGGVKEGLTYEQSKKLAVQTMKGAAFLAEKSDTELSELIEKVCSKGGTTIEAVDYLKETDVEGKIVEAVSRCAEKSRVLGRK